MTSKLHIQTHKRRFRIPHPHLINEKTQDHKTNAIAGRTESKQTFTDYHHRLFFSYSLSLSSIPLLPLHRHPRARFDLICAHWPCPIDLDANVIAFDFYGARSPSLVGHVWARVCTRALAASTRVVGSLLALSSHHAHARRWLTEMLMALLRCPR